MTMNFLKKAIIKLNISTNNLINKFSLTADTFLFEMPLKQPRVKTWITWIKHK